MSLFKIAQPIEYADSELTPVRSNAASYLISPMSESAE